MQQKTRNAIIYAIIVALGGFVFGLDAAIVSGTVRYISAEFMLSDLQVGTVVSAPSLGAIIALCFTGKLADAYGRKNTIIIVAALYVISAVGSALATSYEMLVGFRFIGGLAFSSLSLASMYIGEIAPSKLRGKLVTVNQLNIVVGLSAAYFINYYLVNNATPEQYLLSDTMIWRVMFATELIPAFIWLALVFIIPESPRWLIAKGKTAQASKVLNKVYSEQEARTIFSLIKENILHSDQLSFKEQATMLLSRNYNRALFIGITIAIVQGVTGMNAILFYAPTVFEQVGFGDASFQQALYIGLVSFIFTIAAVLLVDKLGRRRLMIVGLAFAILSHLACWYGFNSAEYQVKSEHIVALSDTLDTQPLQSIKEVTYHSDIEFKQALAGIYDEKTLKKNEAALIQRAITVNPMLILFGILGFIAAFHISIGPIMWVIFSEIFPNSVRSAAIPIAAMVTSISSYFVQQFFPWQLTNFGAASTFLMYAGFGFMGLIVIIFILPETKGKTLEDIELLLRR